MKIIIHKGDIVELPLNKVAIDKKLAFCILKPQVHIPYSGSGAVVNKLEEIAKLRSSEGLASIIDSQTPKLIRHNGTLEIPDISSGVTIETSMESDFGIKIPEESFVAVGDIHGSKYGMTLLKKLAGFGFKVYVLGDVIDNGDESIEILRYLYKHQDIFVPIRGNHEEVFVRRVEESPIFLLRNAMRVKTVIDFYNLPLDERKQLLDWMKSWKYYAYNNDFIMTHAKQRRNIFYASIENMTNEGSGQIGQSIFAHYGDSSRRMIFAHRNARSLYPKEFCLAPNVGSLKYMKAERKSDGNYEIEVTTYVLPPDDIRSAQMEHRGVVAMVAAKFGENATVKISNDSILLKEGLKEALIDIESGVIRSSSGVDLSSESGRNAVDQNKYSSIKPSDLQSLVDDPRVVLKKYRSFSMLKLNILRVAQKGYTPMIRLANGIVVNRSGFNIITPPIAAISWLSRYERIMIESAGLNAKLLGRVYIADQRNWLACRSYRSKIICTTCFGVNSEVNPPLLNMPSANSILARYILYMVFNENTSAWELFALRRIADFSLIIPVDKNSKEEIRNAASKANLSYISKKPNAIAYGWGGGIYLYWAKEEPKWGHQIEPKE